MELDRLLSRLEETHEDEFNHDGTYKQLLAEAIDGRGHALIKVGLFFKSIEAGFGAEALALIHDEPLESFSSADTAQVLLTGTLGFPWADVVSEKKVVIDLGEWNAATNPEQAVKHVAAALSSNPNMRSVLVKGVLLDFSDGWESEVLDWSANEAVKALPATVAVLLSNCTGLSSLDLRLSLSFCLHQNSSSECDAAPCDCVGLRVQSPLEFIAVISSIHPYSISISRSSSLEFLSGSLGCSGAST